MIQPLQHLLKSTALLLVRSFYPGQFSVAPCPFRRAAIQREPNKTSRYSHLLALSASISLITKPQLVTLSKEDMAEIDAFHKKPGMHRTLTFSKKCEGNMVLGWTFEQLGWNMGDGGYVKA
jgi:hypothetical protein